MKLRKSCFGMDYEMESLIQALVIQINLIWNQFHGIIHELIRYAHALAPIERNVKGPLKASCVLPYYLVHLYRILGT